MRISWIKVQRRQFIRCLVSLSFSTSLLIISAVFVLFTIDYNTYERLTREHPIASLTFYHLGKHHYQAVLIEGDNQPFFFELYGDQWQLDVRMIKWKGAAAWAGLKPIYQLERLSGRYQDISLEKNATRSVYALGTSSSLWHLLLDYQNLIPWFDAYYGNATFLPMNHGAKFNVNIGASGLVARPTNHAAKNSLKQWANKAKNS